MKKLFENRQNPNISGDCGHRKIHVENFENLTCPVCGMKLILKAIDMNTNDVDKELKVMSIDHHVDDIGQIHNHFYGKTKLTEYHKVHMYCPNKCVENIEFNVSNTTYGRYRELTEIER